MVALGGGGLFLMGKVPLQLPTANENSYTNGPHTSWQSICGVNFVAPKALNRYIHGVDAVRPTPRCLTPHQPLRLDQIVDRCAPRDAGLGQDASEARWPLLHGSCYTVFT